LIKWEAPLSANADDTVRWRWFDGKPFPYISATSVLGLIVPDGLKKWFVNNDGATVRRVSEQAADRGTKIHDLIEQINLRREIAIDIEFTEIIKQYKIFLSEVRPEFIHTEKDLQSDRFGFSGRADAIVRIGDRQEIWDFKTGRVSTTTGWQLGAYKIAAEEMGIRVDGLRVVQVNPKLNKVEVFNYEHFDFVENMFLKTLDLFKGVYFNNLRRGVSVPNQEKVSFPIEYLTLDSAYEYKRGKNEKAIETGGQNKRKESV